MLKREPWQRLKEIITRIRRECPWDREQTFSSLRGCLLQECYEVLEALDEGDNYKLRGELGDLLTLILLLSEIASEQGKFNIEEVIQEVCNKLVHRHPHVFSSVRLEENETELKQWHKLKQEETSSSILDNIPKTLPALAYSQEIQERASRVGFDWTKLEGAIDNLAKEVREFSQAPPNEREAEFGDLLFTLANIGRRLGIDLEAALRRANRKFYWRFIYMEEKCRKQGRDFASLPLEEKEQLWEEAKKSIHLSQEEER